MKWICRARDLGRDGNIRVDVVVLLKLSFEPGRCEGLFYEALVSSTCWCAEEGAEGTGKVECASVPRKICCYLPFCRKGTVWRVQQVSGIFTPCSVKTRMFFFFSAKMIFHIFYFWPLS